MILSQLLRNCIRMLGFIQYLCARFVLRSHCNSFFLGNTTRSFLCKSFSKISSTTHAGGAVLLPYFFFLVYMGIAMNIWFYNGQGIMGVYYLSIPIEEYAYMVFAPYASIVVWEAFHRAIRRKKR